MMHTRMCLWMWWKPSTIIVGNIMEIHDKRAWLNKHGYSRFESYSADRGEFTVQWSVSGKAFLYTGRGTNEDAAYDNLFDSVVGTLYNICDLNGSL